MNYIAEINAFNDWCEQHYLSVQAQFLWYKLMAKCNRLGWCEWVSVDNLELMGILRVKREQTAIDTRDKLVEAGLIEYIKGKKSKANVYRMISLSNLKVETVVNSVVETAIETVVNSVVETVDLNKLNKTKQNETKLKEKDTNVSQKKSFVPPSFEEIAAYCKERNNDVEPKRVFDYYEAANWKDGEGKQVLNWKQKIIAVWEKNSRKGSYGNASIEELDAGGTHANPYGMLETVL